MHTYLQTNGSNLLRNSCHVNPAYVNDIKSLFDCVYSIQIYNICKTYKYYYNTSKIQIYMYIYIYVHIYIYIYIYIIRFIIRFRQYHGNYKTKNDKGITK